MSRFVRGALLVLITLVLGPIVLRAQTYWLNETTGGITDDILAVTFGTGAFAATTAQGNVLSSLDGMTWSSSAASPGTSLNGIAFGNGSWIAVGTNGTILVSANLKTWVSANSGTTSKLNAVVFDAGSTPPYGSLFIAVGDNGTILSSVDGMTWVSIPSGVTNSLTGISAFFEDVVVCGQGGIVLNNVQVGGTPTIIETGASSGLNAMVELNRFAEPGSVLGKR